jgi:hypothetical protein
MCQSRAEHFEPGDPLTSSFGWRECFIVSPKELHPIHREIQLFSVCLGALGMTERAMPLSRSWPIGRPREHFCRHVDGDPQMRHKPAAHQKGVINGDFSKA